MNTIITCRSGISCVILVTFTNVWTYLFTYQDRLTSKWRNTAEQETETETEGILSYIRSADDNIIDSKDINVIQRQFRILH